MSGRSWVAQVVECVGTIARGLDFQASQAEKASEQLALIDIVLDEAAPAGESSAARKRRPG